MMMKMLLILTQVSLDWSMKSEFSDDRLLSVEREYFDRDVSLMSTAHRLTDSVTMLTRVTATASTQPPHLSGTSHSVYTR